MDRNETIEEYLVLPVRVEKAPPCLRVRCKDWYQILHTSLMHGVTAFLFWVLPLGLVVRAVSDPVSDVLGLLLRLVIVLGWLILGLLVFWLGFWWSSYRSAQEFCERYDDIRAEKMGGESQYDLLEPPIPDSVLKRTFGDWIAWLTEREQGTER